MSLARDTAYNLAGWIAPTALSIVTVPLYLHVVGLERYGLLAICWTLIGFIGFVGLGMGPAVAQRLAIARDSTAEARSRMFWSALAVSAAMAVAGALLLFIIGSIYFTSVAASEPLFRSEIRNALPWLSLCFALSLASGVTGGALQGRQWFGVLNLVTVAVSAAAAIIPLVAAYLLGPTLPLLLKATFVVYVVSFFVQMLICRSAVPLTGQPIVSLSAVRSLLTYGGWVTIISLLVPITMLADRLVIGSRAGPAAVSIYVVPYNLVSRALALPASLSSASLPKLAGATRSEEQALLSLGLSLLLALLMPICVAGNLLMAPFLNLWVGHSVAVEGSAVGCILIFGFWMHGVGHIPSTVLNGRGRPDMVAKLYVAYVLLYFPVLLMLLDRYGLAGAAIAWSIRASFDLTLFWWARTSRRNALHIAGCTVIVLASSVVATLSNWQSPLYWIVLVAIFLLSLVVGVHVIPSETRSRAWELVRVRLSPPDPGNVIP